MAAAATFYFLAGIIFLAVLVVAMNRSGGLAGGRDWSLAWIALYGAGICAALAPSYPSFQPGYPILGLAFCGFLYAGTLRYCGATSPRWLWPMLGALALARVAAQPWLGEVLTQITGALAIGIAIAASTARLARSARSSIAPAWTGALAVALPCNAVAAACYAVARAANWPVEYTLAPWLATGVMTAGIQAGALLIRLERVAYRQSASMDAVVDASPFGLLMTDAGGRVRTLNAKFAEVFGLENPDLHIGAEWSELAMQLRQQVEMRDVEWMSSPNAAALVADEKLPVNEYHFLDGRVTRTEVRNFSARDGRFLGQLWLVIDITEERRVETQRRQTRQLETLGRLASGVAHDFNNQLAAMLVNAENVRESLDTGDPRRASLAELEEAALYCSDIARDLLEFARPTPRRASETDLREFLPSLARRLEDDLPSGAELRLEVAEDAASISANRTQLERVITNLVHNAGDAVGVGGRIRLCVEMRRTDAGPKVAIRVIDDGIGMDADTREHVFEPFFSTKDTGNGLGLAIVYGIVTSHGGEVHVESSPGEGTCIETLWSPAKQAVSVRAPEPARATTQGNETILVVDDQTALRRLIGSTLRRAGYDVIAVESGYAALEAYAEHGERIGLALLDVSMPGISGPQVLERLRDSRPGLPAIFTSGTHVGGEPFGTDPVLAKPFRSATLLHAVRSALDGTKAARQRSDE